MSRAAAALLAALVALALPGPAAGPAFAQQQASSPARSPAAAREPPRRLLLLFEAADTAPLDASQRLLLYESLLVKLGRASERVVVIEHGPDGLPEPEERLREAALARRADAWMRVTVDGGWNDLVIRARAWDLLAGAEAFDLALKKGVRRGAVDLERHFWDELAEAVRGGLREGGRAVARAVTREKLSLKGAPGTKVRGFTGETLTIGDSGEVAIEALLPATFSYRATRIGYYPLEEDVFLEPGQGTLELRQEPGARWALNFYLTMMNYPGFDLSWYPVPNTLWIKLGFNTYLLGLVLAPDQDRSMFASFPLTHLNLSAGAYLNAPDALFRFYLGAGVFARFITGSSIRLEPIAPWGLQPILGMEFSRRTRRRFYVEYAPVFYVPSDPTLFRLSLDLDAPPPILPIPLESPVLMGELSSFRFGLRVLL